MSQTFTFEEFASTDTQTWALELEIQGYDADDYLSRLNHEFVNANVPLADYCVAILRFFYKVGLVGLKLQSHESFVWGVERKSVSSSEISRATARVHPMFWRVLGINAKSNK